MDSDNARREIQAERGELFRAVDNLIEWAIEDQREHLSPVTSSRFQSGFNKLGELEEEGKAPEPIRKAIGGAKATVETVLREMDSDLLRMLRGRKQM
jgi:hypothetical protein